MRLCKGSGDDGAPVVFLKHNVRTHRPSPLYLLTVDAFPVTCCFGCGINAAG